MDYNFTLSSKLNAIKLQSPHCISRGRGGFHYLAAMAPLSASRVLDRYACGDSMGAFDKLHFAAWLSVCLLCAGCASTQLNYNTLEISDTIDAILTKQVLSNLGRFVANPYAIPSMTTLSSGTVTTTNSVSPSFTDPLTDTIASTTSVAKVLGGATTSTTSVVGTTTGKGLTIGATDQWMQNWVTNPIIENHILRRLRALYRFATIPEMTRDQLICEYAIVTLSGPGGKYSIPCDGLGHVSGRTRMINADPDFVTRPGCVICEPLGGAAGRLVVNEKLVNGWLRSTPGDPAAEYALGVYGGSRLYLRTSDVEAFYDFILFVQEATVEQSASASPSSSGGTGTGKKPGRQNPAKPTIVPDTNGRPTQVEPPKNFR